MKGYSFSILTPLLGACAAIPQETGTLEGHVTMGPMLPAVQEWLVEPTPTPEAHNERQIVIYARGGTTEVARAQIAAGGDYRVTLPVGVYVVDINHEGMD